MVSIMAWKRAQGVHGSLFQDHMCPEEGAQFSNINKCSKKAGRALGATKGKTEPESRQREGFGRKRASDPPGMDRPQATNSQKSQ